MLAWLKNKRRRQGVLIITALGLIVLYYFPYFLNGEDSYILIHDNLDSNLSWVKILLDSGQLFAPPSELVPQVFNGIPRSSLYGTYDISLIWFSLFGMYWGYILNKLIMSLVAFIGMFYLLKKYLTPQSPDWLVWGVALLFAILPFWSFTLSVSGLPIVSYAFLGIRAGERRVINWIIIIVFAFYSSLVLSGVFYILVLLLVFIYDWYRTKKVDSLFLIAIGLLGMLYVLSHYPLFYSFIFESDYISHRASFDIKNLNGSQTWDSLDNLFRFGQYHAHSLHTYMLYPILGVFVFGLIKGTIDKRYIFFLVFIVTTSLLYASIRWEATAPFFKMIAGILPIQLQRFHFLHPMLWYILLGFSLSVIYKQGLLGKIIIPIILVYQLSHLAGEREFLNAKKEPTFKQFYAEALFTEIKRFIDKPVADYRVISIGIHPAIAQYNGLYTLDGYFPDYPLQHKVNFREVIAEELEKDEKLKDYYDNWGSRCYAFNAALGRKYLNGNPPKIKSLLFNFEALQKMGGKYLISSTEINTELNKEIELLNVFEHSDSRWKIYLYRNLAINKMK